MEEAPVHWFEKIRIATDAVDFRNQLKISSIFNYLQEAASTHATKLGWGFNRLQELQYFWVLSRIKVEFGNDPGSFGDELKIETWPRGFDGIFALRDFKIYNAKNEVCCLATSAWLLLDAGSLRPVKASGIKQLIFNTDATAAIHETPGKITESANPEFIYAKQVRYTDLDVNRHVNNVKYVEFLLDCFTPTELEQIHFKTIQVNFLQETKFGEELRFSRSKPNSNNYYLEAVNNQGKRVVQAIIEIMG